MDNYLSKLIPNLHEKKILELSNIKQQNNNENSKQIIFIENNDSWKKIISLNNQQYDIIYGNCIFGNLTDDKLKNIFEKFLQILTNNGQLCFVEKCFSKDEILASTPDKFNRLLETVAVQNQSGIFVFEIEKSKCVLNEIKDGIINSTNVGWVAKRTKAGSSADAHGFKTFQEFLNNKQYSITGIKRYERIFGDGFISTGGLETTKEFVGWLDLKEKQKVLDVGCGIGGGPFYMINNFGVHVTGIDLSSNVISIAMEKAFAKNIQNVEFEISDATKRLDVDEKYDVIYSRDTILHILDKKHLFSLFYKWLKPGGQLFISDYCCKEGEWSDECIAYVKQRGYHLLTLQQYGELIESVGFKKINFLNVTDRLMDTVKRESETLQKNKDQFIKDFSEDDYISLVDGWKSKFQRCADGEQVWGAFHASK